MKITWLASYPKSGNTYIRFLLHNYIFGDVGHSKELQNRIPDLHKYISNNLKLNTEKQKKIFMKSHFPMSVEHPYFEQTERFIYIIRHPVDTMLSNANYFGYDSNQPERFHRFIENYINLMGSKRWVDFGYGTWPSNVAGWLEAANHTSGHFIRYEDLRHKTESTMKGVLEFIGLAVDDEKLANAIDNSSIERLQKREEQEGAEGVFRTLNENTRFVNQGKTGQTLDDIEPQLAIKFEKRFGSLMNLLGY